MIDYGTFHGVPGKIYVEPPSPHGLRRRAFRAIGDAWEYAYLRDIQLNGRHARFYGYAPRDLPASITEKPV